MKTLTFTLNQAEVLLKAKEHISWDSSKEYNDDQISHMAYNVVMEQLFSHKKRETDIDIDIEKVLHSDTLQEINIKASMGGVDNAELLAKAALAKESVELVNEEALGFASPEVKAIYDAIMPEIRKEVKWLHDEIEKGLGQTIEGLGEHNLDLAKNTDSFIHQISANLNTHIGDMKSRLSSIEGSVNSIQRSGGLRSGNHRN